MVVRRQLYEQTVFLYSISPDARDIADIFEKIPVESGFVTENGPARGGRRNNKWWSWPRFWVIIAGFPFPHSS
jgi:hypothetical protein